MARERSQTEFGWFLAGVGSWFASFGMQSVLFAWLVAVVLRQPPERVGIAQMAAMAPSILFMLLGGAVADRGDGRALLIRYHLLAALPTSALAALAAGGWLSYPVVIGYGLAMGTLGAFVMPARDSLLTRVAVGALPRAIAVTSAGSLLFQLGGTALGGLADRVGAVGLLLAQAAILAAGGAAATRIAPAPPGTGRGESRLAAIRSGVREAWDSERIFPVVVTNFAVGIFFVGAFIVVMPVTVRDVYGGGAAELALINTSFWGGTVVSTMTQIRLRPLRWPGRVIIVTLALGAGILAAMAIPGPLWGLAALCFLWGAGAGVVMIQGRTIVQLAAPDTHRGRLLAIYQLGLMGGAPLGALVMGYVAAAAGPRPAVVYPAIAMLAVLAFLLLRSRLWQQEAA